MKQFVNAEDFEIRREDLASTVATGLISALNTELTSRYPEEGANHFRLDLEEVQEGRGAFFVAYSGPTPLGCGAIRRLDANTAEVKRMFVDPGARGYGVGRALLESLEAEARRLDVCTIVLETGARQHEALGLYESAGFVRTALFGEYIGSPLSICMLKRL